MEVHFTPELERKLHDLAAKQGKETDELLQDVVAGYLEELSEPEMNVGQGRPLQTVADIILSSMRKVPPEIMAALPRDGAANHDHYIYGWPKNEG